MSKIIDVSNKACALLQEKGITKYGVSVTQKETREFNIEDGEFSLLRTLFDNGLSVSTFIGTKQGAASGNDFTDEGIKATVEAAVTSTESSAEDPDKDIAPDQGKHVFKEGVAELDTEKFFERIKEFKEALPVKYPKIKLMQVFAKCVKKNSYYVNTNGTTFENTEGWYDFVAEFAGNDGQKTTGINVAYCSFVDLDTPFLDQEVISHPFDVAVAQLNEVTIDGKFEGRVIVTPDMANNLMYAALSNFIGGGVILDGTSIWKDKLGQKVVSDKLNLKVDPFDKHVVCGERWTGDGFKAEPVSVFEKGVLKNFLIGLYVANKKKLTPAKASMGSFIIEPGDSNYADMLKSVKKGLILGGFSGGNPGANGEISGVAKNSFLVEDGEIKGAVSETMINGNLADMLNNIVAISKETLSDGSGNAPYIAIDGVVISGK
ncbi:MAG: TldD/PmbA family protein [Lachnospiraceae bacterium]|nr:TldD/PmbA family protein [Lachnospiraceae bacterium]